MIYDREDKNTLLLIEWLKIEFTCLSGAIYDGAEFHIRLSKLTCSATLHS